MQRDKVVRGLRIAVSAFFAVLSVLLIVLWVRSFTSSDFIRGALSESQVLLFRSYNGRMTCDIIPDDSLYVWKWKSESAQDFEQNLQRVIAAAGSPGIVQPKQPSFTFRFDGLRWNIRSPHWFLVAVFGVIAAAFGLRKPHSPNFSLRTLLIATTAVA